MSSYGLNDPLYVRPALRGSGVLASIAQMGSIDSTQPLVTAETIGPKRMFLREGGSPKEIRTYYKFDKQLKILFDDDLIISGHDTAGWKYSEYRQYTGGRMIEIDVGFQFIKTDFEISTLTWDNKDDLEDGGGFDYFQNQQHWANGSGATEITLHQEPSLGGAVIHVIDSRTIYGCYLYIRDIRTVAGDEVEFEYFRTINCFLANHLD